MDELGHIGRHVTKLINASTELPAPTHPLIQQEDAAHQQRLQLIRQRQAKTTREGVLLGLEALRSGLSSATTGVVHETLEGARTGEVLGLLRGVQRGVRGLWSKPLAGVAVLAVKTTEGVASDLMRVTHAQVVDQYVRMRQPRMLGTGLQARLLPYPRLPPVSVEGGTTENQASYMTNARTASSKSALPS